MAHLRFWTLLLCLQNRLEAAGSDTDILTVNGVLGDPVTFPLNIPESQNIISIAWVNSQTSVALVKPSDSGTAPNVFVTHQNYFHRINVSSHNYNLEISNLRREDAGVYKADINIKTSETKAVTTTKRYSLHVYRRLGKPKITQSLMTSVNGTCNVTLTCSVETEVKNVTYSWSPLGEEGSVLQIFQTPGSQTLTYTCTARNPVSNSSASVAAQQLCADAAVGVRSRDARLLGGLAVLSASVLVVPPVLLFLLCKRARDAVSKNTIYTYVTASRGIQPEEPRIYDEIPPLKGLPAKEKPVNTIYSVLQDSDKVGETQHLGQQTSWDFELRI